MSDYKCENCGHEIKDGSTFCDKCGAKVVAKNKKDKPKKKKSGILIGLLSGILVIAVIGVAGVMTKNFLDSINSDSDKRTESASSKKKNSKSDDINDVKTDAGATNDEYVDYDKVLTFAQKHSGKWDVFRYKESAKEQDWHIYDLGKKMLIGAYNYLNDYDTTSGGYNKKVGSKTTTKEEYKDKWGNTYNGEIYSDGANTYNSSWEVVKKTTTTSSTPVYEYVPKTTVHHEGEDIKYEAPFIVISDEYIDMQGMGGTVYSIYDFKYEKRYDQDDQEYLVHNSGKFAFTYQNGYIQYCEPDEFGYFVSWYAFIK